MLPLIPIPDDHNCTSMNKEGLRESNFLWRWDNSKEYPWEEYPRKWVSCRDEALPKARVGALMERSCVVLVQQPPETFSWIIRAADALCL